MNSQNELPAVSLLTALNAVLTQVAEPSQVLRTILGQAVSRTEADRGLFVEVNPSGALNYRLLYKFQKEDLSETKEHYSRNVLAKVRETGKTVRLDNAMTDPGFGNMESVLQHRMISVLCMPIKIKEIVRAIVHLESNRPGHFTEHHEAVMGSFLELAGPALEALKSSEGMREERDRLAASEQRALQEVEESREVLAREWSFSRFIGKSRAVRELEQQVQRAAETEFPVLLLGETGSGKSILARVLHHAGARAHRRFATLFCPSLEKGMVETELFGHKKGAFTGAVADREGKVPATERGTLFLDEIGELPPEIQPKLLRLLQEKTYERVGEAIEREADVRIIAATNRDLDAEVNAGRFRRDLYERLNFLPIRIPPLRERSEDIPLLLNHCLLKYDVGRWIEISGEAQQFLVDLDFTWPGNVRHLEHLAARMAMERKKEPFMPEDISRLLDTSSSGAPVTEESQKISLEIGLPALLAQEEKKWLQMALERYPGLKRTDLAAKLKISPAVLYKKLKIFGLGG